MKKNINYIILKICLLIIIGILAIITPNEWSNYFHLSLYFCMACYGLIQIIIFLKRKSFSYFNLIFVLFNLLMTMLIIFYPSFYIKLLPIIIGLYILIIGIARLMTTFIYHQIPESKINILIRLFILLLVLF